MKYILSTINKFIDKNKFVYIQIIFINKISSIILRILHLQHFSKLYFIIVNIIYHDDFYLFYNFIFVIFFY